MNKQFSGLSEEGGFATALVSTFFATTMTYSLCNAGHPEPLVFHQQSSEWSPIAKEPSRSDLLANTPLGAVEEAGYGQVNLRLGTGDLVLSFSDAVIESQHRDGRPLGQSGILEIVRELNVRQPEQLIPTLVSHIKSLKKENLEQDDATILLMESTGGGPSLSNTLLSPVRFMGKVADRTCLSGTEKSRGDSK